MRLLVWHVHGGWMDAFVRGGHDYLMPTTDARDGWGLGRGGRDWPPSALEISPSSLRDEPVDLVVLQRPEEIALAERHLGRRLGRDVPAVYVEHNAPAPTPVTSPHPLADRSDITLVHVTHFNNLMWDNGRAPTVVIEHGIPDPGMQYTGEIDHLGVVINEPVRRWRVTGTDLLPRFTEAGHVDVFGMGAESITRDIDAERTPITPIGALPPTSMHEHLARRRVYLHTTRWTSLGLSLLEAMHLGMPVVALQTTEAARAVPPEAGFVSTNITELVAAAHRLVRDPDEARRRGSQAREAVLARYGLDRFLHDWDSLLAGVPVHHAPVGA
jgi:hypothetical protein